MSNEATPTRFCNYCRIFTDTDEDGDCIKCHLSKPPLPDWERDKTWLSNKLYGDIFPVLAGYETNASSAHATTQSLVKETIERCSAWVRQNTRGQE